MTPGIRLQWGPKEIEDLQERVRYLQMVIDALNENLDTTAEIIDHMKSYIENAPCLAARPGELTYECRHDNLCRVCEWRNDVTCALHGDWGIIMERK